MSRQFTALAIALFCWTVQAQAVRVIDGDTFVARAEIWPNLFKVETVRLLGVDTPELRGADRAKALDAKTFTEEWVSRGPFTLETCKRDSFGRLLATVTRAESALAQELISADRARVRLR